MDTNENVRIYARGFRIFRIILNVPTRLFRILRMILSRVKDAS